MAMVSRTAMKAVLIGLLAAITAVVAREASTQQGPPGNAAPMFRQPMFYLTVESYDGANALAACAPGFHMASMWEIFDPSNLLYDTTLGATQDDSGDGPPNDFSGWIRTGNNASGGGGAGDAGRANCHAWTSNDETDRGTNVELVQSFWGQDGRPNAFVQPWAAGANPCDIPTRVWCVEDR